MKWRNRKNPEAPISQAELRSLVQEIARTVQIQGVLGLEEETHSSSAEGEPEWTDLRLSSTTPKACPILLTVYENEAMRGDVTIEFGGSYHEAWLMSRQETLEVVKQFLEAIMEGNYVEWRRGDGEGLDDRLGVLTNREGVVLHNDLGWRSEKSIQKKGYRVKRYNPY